MKKSDIFSIILIGGVLLGFVYYFFFQDKADNIAVKPLEDKSQYSIYDGSTSYEYWKSTLSTQQQVLYEEIKESFLQFLPSFSTQVKGKITVDEFEDVYVAVQLDHPEIFWMKSYSAMSTVTDAINKDKKIILQYAYTQAEAKEIKGRLEKSYVKIIEEAKTQENDFKKIKLVHDRLVELGTYTKYTDEEYSEFQSMVSIFDTGDTVCAGFTYGFKFIMDNLGIDSISVRDVSHRDQTENHIWNMVNLYGKWYNLDITYDDNLTKDDSIAYNYFLIGNEEFYKTHKMDDRIPGGMAE